MNFTSVVSMNLGKEEPTNFFLVFWWIKEEASQEEAMSCEAFNYIQGKR
jgi:hypothetical protein